MSGPPIEQLIEPRRRQVGTGHVRRLLPFRERRMVGPFIFADLIGPTTSPPGAGMDIDAHPHIGLSTVSYLFSGGLVHRDSTGAVQTIEPGAVNWMTAGAGITHTERSTPEGRTAASEMHGLQTWVALPDDAADGPPGFEHQGADTIPGLERDGASIRLAAGTGYGLESPVTVSSPLVLAEIRLEHAAVPVDDAHPERAVLAVEGELLIDGRPIAEGNLAVIGRGESATVSGTGRAMLIGGEPVGKRFIWWNFVHADRDRIEQAKDDWTNQRFPKVPDDHDPWVPLPE
ncbi:MAG: pirin family protein [Acidimicrobiales bacterium]